MEDNLEVVMDQAVAEPETAEGEARDEVSEETSKDRRRQALNVTRYSRVRMLPARRYARGTTLNHVLSTLSRAKRGIVNRIKLHLLCHS